MFICLIVFSIIFTTVFIIALLKSFEKSTLRQMIAIIILFYYQVENKVFAFYFNYNGPRVRKQAVAQACKITKCAWQKLLKFTDI